MKLINNLSDEATIVVINDKNEVLGVLPILNDSWDYEILERMETLINEHKSSEQVDFTTDFLFLEVGKTQRIATKIYEVGQTPYKENFTIHIALNY